MDGKKTSGNMYETYYKKYHANATWYSFAQSSNNNLIRKVEAAKKRGKEYCDLVSSEPYPMRQEHIDYFLKKGYDIYWSVLDLETGPAYYYKAVWTEDAEGKLKEGF